MKGVLSFEALIVLGASLALLASLLPLYSDLSAKTRKLFEKKEVEIIGKILEEEIEMCTVLGEGSKLFLEFGVEGNVECGEGFVVSVGGGEWRGEGECEGWARLGERVVVEKRGGRCVLGNG